MPPIILNREQLYERVWTTPIETLARELGLSGRGLKKAMPIRHPSASARILGQEGSRQARVTTQAGLSPRALQAQHSI